MANHSTEISADVGNLSAWEHSSHNALRPIYSPRPLSEADAAVPTEQGHNYYSLIFLLSNEVEIQSVDFKLDAF